MITKKNPPVKSPIRKIRKKLNLSQEEFAESLMIPYSSYKNYEYRNDIFPIDYAIEITQKYNCSLYEIYELELQLNYFTNINWILSKYDSQIYLSIDNSYWIYLEYVKKYHCIPAYNDSTDYNVTWCAPIDASIQEELNRPKNIYYSSPHSLYAIQEELQKTDQDMADLLYISRKTYVGYLQNNNLPIKKAIILANKYNFSLEQIYNLKESLYYDLREILYTYENYIVLDKRKLRHINLLPTAYSIKIGERQFSINDDYIIFKYESFNPSYKIPHTNIIIPHSQQKR